LVQIDAKSGCLALDALVLDDGKHLKWEKFDLLAFWLRILFLDSPAIPHRLEFGWHMDLHYFS
jgi:hypothetical protein